MKIWYAALPLFLAIAGCSSASGANDGFEPFIPPATDHPAVDGYYLQEFNHTTNDLAPAPDYYHDDGRMRTDGEILPYDERRCDRWNTDQFRVDGGMNGMIEMDGADVLEPYWMGRYYGFIVSE